MQTPGNVLGGTLAGVFSGSSAFESLKNQSNLAITARIHKDFLP
jgi:hypothetical protein